MRECSQETKVTIPRMDRHFAGRLLTMTILHVGSHGHCIADMSLGHFWRFIGSYFRTMLVLFDPSYPVAPDQRNKRRHASQKKTFCHSNRTSHESINRLPVSSELSIKDLEAPLGIRPFCFNGRLGVKRLFEPARPSSLQEAHPG